MNIPVRFWFIINRLPFFFIKSYCASTNDPLNHLEQNKTNSNEDGLYVLLRPMKKSGCDSNGKIIRPQDDPRVPTKLRGMIMLETLPETCPVRTEQC
jgi:hypothetical protein